RRRGGTWGGPGGRAGGARRHTPATYPAAAGRARRKAGYDFAHIAVDDYSRLAYAEVLPDEKATTAAAFLRRAIAFYRRYGICVERVISDNGSAYRSTVHALACRRLRLKHLRTRPYRPPTNGKAERFIRTLPAGWGYAAIYPPSSQ